MKQFSVPQFIDVEPKVIGPVTVRQFIMFIVGGLFIFLSYKLADFALFIIEAIIIAGLVVVFAFLKINGRPFHLFLLSFLHALTRPKVRVWKKTELEVKKTVKAEPEEAAGPKIAKPLFRRPAEISELALLVDTGGAYQTTEDTEK